MHGVQKRVLRPERRRSLPKEGFSWIDRRIVRDGFLSGLTGPETLLYYFLVTVADQDGLSYHGERKTAGLLKLSLESLEQARRGLERKDLIIYRAPLYQVLSLPEHSCNLSLKDVTVERRDANPPAKKTDEPTSLAHLLRPFTDRPN